jgi:hypothetical protein
MAAALRPCACGGRFRHDAPARCPGCGVAFVDYGTDPSFRIRQTHLPLVEGGEIVTARGSRLWTDEHLAPFLADVRPGPLESRSGYLTLALRFRNRDGWLVIPLGYAAVLRTPDGGEIRAFRPADFGDRPPSSPEEWQARQAEEDAAFAADVERDLGFRPLLDGVEADETVEGFLAFPLAECPEGSVVLEIGRTLEIEVGIA